MRIRVSTILTATLCLLLAAAQPASAQNPGRVYFGALYDAIFHVSDETSATGAHFDVSKDIVQRTNTTIYGVGEVGVNNFESGTIASYMGGARVAAGINPKMSPFFQFLFGAQNCCGSTDLAFQPGIGLDYAWLTKLTLRAQLDFRRVFFESGSVSETRLAFGVVIPIRVD